MNENLGDSMYQKLKFYDLKRQALFLQGYFSDKSRNHSAVVRAKNQHYKNLNKYFTSLWAKTWHQWSFHSEWNLNTWLLHTGLWKWLHWALSMSPIPIYILACKRFSRWQHSGQKKIIQNFKVCYMNQELYMYRKVKI